MRLTRLDLDRYGPFTQTQLDFRPDADLHIVYGANEAGKSSALAAVTDLLYGFEPRSPANFRHRYEDLKVGATMLRGDGSALQFWRRKRLRNSLTDADDSPLDDGLLDSVLSGISREVFLAAFGLDQAGLREGARQMLAAQGEVGESLFAAASGLRTLVSVRSGLEGEADGLFGARRSSKRAFYEAQDRYDAARKALKEQSLRAETVRELEEHIATQAAQALVLAEQLKDAGIRRSRIDRVRRTAPLLMRMEQAEQALAALHGVPDLPEGLAGEIEAALARAQAGRETLARLAIDVSEAEQALASIHVNEDLLATSEAVTDLNDKRAALAKALQDLPRRQTEARDLARDLDDLAQRLGQPDRTSLARLRPDDLALERIRMLAEKRREAEMAAAENRRAADRALEGIEALTRKASSLAAGSDPEPLRQRLQAMRPALAEATALGDREAEFLRRKALFADRLARLSPGAAHPDALWTWAEPSEGVLAEWERRFAELDGHARQDAAEESRLVRAIAAADAALEKQAGEDHLIDSALLAHERQERDALFDAVIAEPAPALIKAYRKIVAQTDALSDRRLGQAESLARRELMTRKRDEDAAALEDVRASSAAGARGREKARQDWQALFAPLGCEAAGPPVMRRFLAEIGGLREERQALSGLEAQIGQGQRRLAEERPALEALASAAGLADAALQSLPSLIRLLEDRLGALEKGAREARSVDDQIAVNRAELARTEKAEAAAKAALAGMQADWAAALTAIGLQTQASVQEAAKASELWIAVQGKLAQFEDINHRITTILDDGADFAKRATALAGPLLPDEAGEPAAIAQALMAGLTSAREADARRRTAREAVDRQRAAFTRAQADQHRNDEVIASLAQKAGCEPAGLGALASDLLARAALRRDLAQVRSDLAAQGDGLDEDTLKAEAAAIGVDRAAGEGEVVQAELAGLAEQDKQVALGLGELRRQREAIEREAGAAGAAQSLEDARSDMERITREYLVLKTASLLIEAGLERQLKSEQGPLIARAGDLFATMTGGGFAGIATLYDDDDRLRLAARRTDGNTTDIAGLSEGTRDQLYLSLRLANLEGMAARREVPPFIGDDLVMTFDEDRVAAALQVLAVKESPLQKILFTHHRHVVDIARERLGMAVDIVILGARE